MGNRIDPANAGTPTDSKVLSAEPKKSGITFGLGTAKKTGAVVEGTGRVKELNPEFDSFAERLPGVEGVYAPEEIWQSERALRQSNLEQTGNAIARVGLNVIPEIVKQASNMFDFSGDYESENAIASVMTGWQNDVNENFGIYRENPNEALNFGDYAYWAEQGSNLVTSALAFAALGYATGGALGTGLKGIAGAAKTGNTAVKGATEAINLGIKAEQGIAKGQSLVKPVTEFIKKGLTQRNVNGLTNAWLMNRAEGVGVAVDTFKNTYDKRVEELQKNNKDGMLSEAQIDTQAKADAAQAAAYAFNVNKANIALNITSSFAFVKPTIGSFRKTLQETGVKHALIDVVKEGGQEAVEESINFIAQKRAEAGDAKLGFAEGLKTTITEGMKDLASAEGAEAALLGAVGGIAQTGATKAGSFIRMHHNDMYDDAYKRAFSSEHDKIYKDIYDEKYESIFQKEYMEALREVRVEREEISEEDLQAIANDRASNKAHELTAAEANKLASEAANAIAIQEAGAKDKRVSYNDIAEYKNSVLEKERENINKFFGVTDEKGKIKILEAYNNIDIFNNTSEILDLDDKIKEAVATQDFERAEELTNMKFDTRIVQAMENGTLGQLEDSLKAIRDLTPEEAVEAKVATSVTDTAYKAQAQRGLKSIEDIEKMAYQNGKYLNGDSITGLDINIYRNAERINKLMNEVEPYGDKSDSFIQNLRGFGARIKNPFTAPIEEDTIEDELKAEDTEEIKAKKAELVKLFAAQEAAVKKRVILSSKEFQKQLEAARAEATKQARDEEDSKKKAAKQAALDAKERDKKFKKAAANTVKDVKTQKPGVATPDVATDKGDAAASVKKDTEKKPAEGKKGSHTVKIEIPQRGTVKSKQDTVSLIDSQLLALRKLKDKHKISNADAKLFTVYSILEEHLSTASRLMSDGKMIPLESIQTVIDSLPAVRTVLGGAVDRDAAAALLPYIDQTELLLEAVANVFKAAISVAQSATAAQEVDAPITSSDTDDDFEDDTEDDSHTVNLSDTINNNLSINDAKNSINRLTVLIDNVTAMGYPVNTYADVEKFLIKVLDREALVKLTPQLIRTWDALMMANNTPQRMVGEGAYKAISTMTQEEYIASRAKDGLWDDAKEAEVDAVVANMVDSANKADEVLPTKSYSQSVDAPQFKSISSLNLAYLAKAYNYATTVGGQVINKIKTDVLGFNENLDTRALDPDQFNIGDTVTLSPLKPGSKHTYIENGMNVEVTRLKDNPDMVRFEYYGIDDTTGKSTGLFPNLTRTEAAVTHLPIFIKKSGNDKYQGMFLHIADWVNEDNMGGTTEDIEEEREKLLDVRQKVLNNKGKNLEVKIVATSDGIYLTDGTSKPISQVSQVNVPEVAILNNNFKLKSGRDKEHHFDNNIDLTKFNIGSTFMIVKNGNKTYALPVKKKPYAELEHGEDIADTIVKVLDLFLTKNHTSEQKELAKTFKRELNLNTSKFNEVLPFIKKFIYTEFYKGTDPEGFLPYMNMVKDSKQSIGTSVFNMNVTEKGKPFLQFGRIGAGKASILTSDTILQKDKDQLLASLKNHILDSYLNTNLNALNQTREVAVLNSENKKSFIGKSYKDFLRDNLFTILKPETINVNGKDKEIYTIQKTIQIEVPVTKAKVSTAISADKKTTDVELPTDVSPITVDESINEFDSIVDDLFGDLEAPIESSDTDDDIDETDESLLNQEVDDEALQDGEDKPVSLLEKYDFIDGVDSNTVQAILDNSYNYLVNNIIGSEGSITVEEALDVTFGKIADYFADLRNTRQKLLNIKADTTEKQTQKDAALLTMDTKIATRAGLYNTVLTNKDKFRAKLQERIKREGIFQKGSAEDIAKYKAAVKAKQDAEKEAAIKAALDAGIDITGDVDFQGIENNSTVPGTEENQDAPEPDEPLAEEEAADENGWNTENIYKNSFKALDTEVRNFFRGIENKIYNKNGKQIPTLLGLPQYVDTMDAYLTVQHILANYPNQTKKEATYENYVSLIKKEVSKRPFLQEVVDRLNDDNVSEKFKTAFVISMNVQYNNLIMADIKAGGATKVIKLDSANALKLSLGKWEANFNKNGNYTVTTDENDNPVKTINPETLAYLEKEYVKVLKYSNTPAGKERDAKSDDTLKAVKNIYDTLGIELSPKFYSDLGLIGVVYGNTIMGLDQLVVSPMFVNAITSIIGDKGKGISPNNNLFITPLFQNYGFNRLAKLNAEYETKLYGNSAKDVGGNTVSSYSEMKNIMDSFFKNRDGESYVISTFSDPYRDVRKQVDEDNSLKTWLEGNIRKDGGGYKLNRSTLFSDVFEHFMWNGASFYSEKGKDRVAVEKMTDFGLLKMHFNAFINEGTTQVKDGRTVHIGYLPFFTMSDKKIPSTFKVPMEKFDRETFLESQVEALRKAAAEGTQEDIDKLESVIAQRTLIFNSLVRPELNRIIALSKDGEIDKINIEGYERRNLKFYQAAYLNDIDFDYIDGDRTKGLDTTGELRRRLGLEPTAMYSIEDTDINNKGGRILNAAVLEKDTVQQFMLEKTIEHLLVKYRTKNQELVAQGFIVRDKKDPSITMFQNDKGLDIKSIAKYTGQKPPKDGTKLYAMDAVLNFVVNTALGFSNMQQLLVTDPIQFAKTGKSEKIRQQLQDLKLEETALELSTQGRTMTAAEVDRYDAIVLKREELQEAYRTAWAYEDAEATYDNQAKRLASDNASGTSILPANGKDSFNLLVLKDYEVSSDFIDEYRTIFKEAGYSDNEIDNTLLSGYKKINTADGLEITTLNEHLNIMVGRALLSPKEASDILAADNAGTLSMKQYGKVLTSMKLVYGHTFVDGNGSGINRRVYLKSSSFPLSKTFTKGLPIDKLRQFMEDKKIDRAAFESAVKVGGTKTKPQVFKEDGTIDTSVIDMDAHVIKDMPRAGHKNQTELPYDEAKTAKRDSTQQSKMQFNNLQATKGFVDPITGKTVTGKVLQKGYNAVVNDYYKQKFYKLRDRIFTADREIDFVKLHEILMSAANERGYSQNDKSFFDLNEDKTGFVFPLWLSENTDKIEALLNSIVDNNVRIRKRRGFSKVLVSDSILGINKATKSSIVLLDKNRQDKLLPMRKDPKTGKMLPAEIVVTFPLRDNNDNLLDVNDYVVDGQLDMTRIPQEILEGMGLRIPYQGINSSSNVTIVGFLPANVDGVAFGPKDWVNQMGSDFDADKLYIDIYNTIYDKNTDSFRKITDADIERHRKQRNYLKEKGKLTRLQKENIKLEASKEDHPLYKRNVKEINRSIAKLNEMAEGKPELEYLADYYDTSNMLEKLLENKMTAYSMAVLANPHSDVQSQRVMSIDSIVLEDLKGKIIDNVYKAKTDKHWTPNNHSYQVKKYMAARGGKTGVSTFSSNAVLNALLQSIELPVNFLNFDGRNSYPVTYNLYGKKSNRLNDSKTIDGGYKSDIIQALQSIAVDNERMLVMDKLNINDYTSDFIRAATQVGYNAEDIFYLINHPVIKEYVTARNNDTPFKNPVNYTEVNGKTSYRNTTDYTAGQKELTHEMMLEDIEKGEYDPNNRHHDTIFKVFQDLSSRGKQLKQLGGLLNIDSSGLGSNLLFSLNKEKAVEELKGNKVISNVRMLLNDDRPDFDQAEDFKKLVRSKDNSEEDTQNYKDARQEYEEALVKEGFTKNKSGWSKNTSIPGSAIKYALKLNNTLWRKIFPYDNYRFENIRSEILGLHRSKDIDLFLEDKRNEALKLAANDKKGNFQKKAANKDKIVSTSPKADAEIEAAALKSYRAFLFSAVAGLYGTSASRAREKLLDDNKLATIVSDIKTNNLLPDNKLIGRLIIETVDEDIAGKAKLNIIFDAGTGDSFEEDRLLQDMISLIESKDSVKTSLGEVKVSDLARDLILHQLVTSGVQKAKQFIKHIPHHHLNNIGLYKKMSDIVRAHDNNFIEQYIQHNPEAVYSKALSKDIINKNGLFSEKSGVIKLKEDETGYTKNEPSRFKSYSDYVSVKNNKEEFRLYKRSSYNPNVYIAISTLGNGTITEYDATSNNSIGSIFSENNENYNWTSNIDAFESTLQAGYEPVDVITEMNRLIKEGNADKEKNDPNKIYKICP